MLTEQQKQQVRQQFPGIKDDDLDVSNQDELISRVASVTGEDRTQVRNKLSSITGS